MLSCVQQLELPMSRVRDIILSSFPSDQQPFALQKWNFLRKMVCNRACFRDFVYRQMSTLLLLLAHEGYCDCKSHTAFMLRFSASLDFRRCC